MAKYFIDSESGSDSNPGTKTLPFKSIYKYNQIRIAGDAVEIFDGKIAYGNMSNYSGSFLKKTTVSGYGGAGKWTISGYKRVKPASWEVHSPNVFRVQINNPDNYTQNIWDTNTDVGHLFINGIIFGGKKFTLTGASGLLLNWDFYSDATHLYVKLEDNPANYEVEFATQDRIVRMAAGLELYDGVIMGGGRHGVDLFAGQNKLINVDVKNIGGCTIMQNGVPGRLGNGVEIFDFGKDIEYIGGEISEVYDAAVTLQGYSDQNFEDVRIKGLKVRDCSQSFEAWLKKNTQGNVGGFYRCVFELNQCYDAGRGWGAKYRPELDVVAHLLAYGNFAVSNDITLRNNLFYGSLNGLLYDSNPNFPFKSENNVVILDDGSPVQNGKPISIENAQAYVEETGLEVGSKFRNIPSSTTSIPTILRKNMADVESLKAVSDQNRQRIDSLKSDINSLSNGTTPRATSGNTATGGVSDAGYWAKVPSINIPLQYASDFSITLLFTCQAGTPQSAIVTFTGKQGAVGDAISIRNLTASVGYISAVGTEEPFFTPGGFKIVCGGRGQNFDIYVRKNIAGGRVNVKELGISLYDFATITYAIDAPWQAGEPTATYSALSQPSDRYGIKNITDTTESLKLSDYGPNGELICFLTTGSANAGVNLLPVAQSKGLRTIFIKRGSDVFTAAINPNGTELINEVNAPIILNKKFLTATIISSGIQNFSIGVRDIFTGDVEITDATKGLVLKSPNGSRWRIKISDTGVLTTTAL